MRNNRTTVAIAAGVAFTLGMTACSDRNKDETTATTSAPAASTPATGSSSAAPSSSGAATSSSAAASSSAPAAATGQNAGVDKVVNPSDEKGGTLRAAHPADWDSLDPGDTYYGLSWNFLRNYARPLVSFKAAPGKEGNQLVPDLAEALGVPTDDAKTWTYKLRDGIKYEDGTAVTSKDVKYAVLRSLDKEIFPNGPTYFNDFLALEEGYKGPYKSKGVETKAIETPDDKTIVFHLKQTFSGMDYFAMLPSTAPVPVAKDTGAEYKKHVISTGPYKFGTNNLGKNFELVRNENYDPASDPDSGRKALADKITVELNVNADDLDNRLIAGELDVDLNGTGLSPAAQGKVLADATLKEKTDSAAVARSNYIQLNQDVAPLDNLDCRKAVILAADHTGYQRAYGGATGGDIATSLMPPLIPGYKEVDPFDIKNHANGDVEGAKAALTACGKPDGFSTNMSYRVERPKEKATAEAMQQSLAKVGIKVTIKPFPQGDYFKLYAGKPDYAKANGLGMLLMSWGADWPDGFGFLQQIVDSRVIRAAGNTNLGIKIPEVDALIDKALAETDVKAREPLWGDIDQKIMDNAEIIPGVWVKGLLFRPDNVTNVFINDGFSMYDFATMGTTKK